MHQSYFIGSRLENQTYITEYFYRSGFDLNELTLRVGVHLYSKTMLIKSARATPPLGVARKIASMGGIQTMKSSATATSVDFGFIQPVQLLPTKLKNLL